MKKSLFQFFMFVALLFMIALVASSPPAISSNNTNDEATCIAPEMGQVVTPIAAVTDSVSVQMVTVNNALISKVDAVGYVYDPPQSVVESNTSITVNNIQQERNDLAEGIVQDVIMVAVDTGPIWTQNTTSMMTTGTEAIQQLGEVLKCPYFVSSVATINNATSSLKSFGIATTASQTTTEVITG